MKKYVYLLSLSAAFIFLSCNKPTEPAFDKAWREARDGQVYTNKAITITFQQNGDMMVEGQKDVPNIKFVSARSETEAFYRLDATLTELGYNVSATRDKTYLFGAGFAVKDEKIYQFDYSDSHEAKVNEWNKNNTSDGKTNIKSDANLNAFPVPNMEAIEWNNFPKDPLAILKK